MNVDSHIEPSPLGPSELAAVALLEIWEGGKRIDWGTAFLISPCHALTALHVVADRTVPGAPTKGDLLKLVFLDAERGADGKAPIEREAYLVESHFDAALDWALLAFSDEVLGIEPLLLRADAVSALTPFQSAGFARVNSSDGIVFSGHIENPNGRCDGVRAIQLYSVQAGALKAQVSGQSGAPVFCRGAVIGLIRAFFKNKDDDTAAAGTLYACPIGEPLGDPLVLELARTDPCVRVPALPADVPFPAWDQPPFRSLKRYAPADARLFFGRCRELAAVVQVIDGERRIALLYGQSGVGKSSLLEAGIEPRLAARFDVRIRRRTRERGLFGELGALLGIPESDPQQFAAAWRALEGQRERDRLLPILAVLDQAEEAFTRPRAGGHAAGADDIAAITAAQAEMDELCAALHAHFAGPSTPPATRLLLSFRKEWLPEIDGALQRWSLPAAGVRILPVDADAIVEIVLGIPRTPSLNFRYNLTVKPPELARRIAEDLGRDAGSAITPALSILLSNLWQEARKRARDQPTFDLTLYEHQAARGLGLDRFLSEQLAALPPALQPHVASGLALELCLFHTRSSGTAEQRSDHELMAQYGPRYQAVKLLALALEDVYLLVDGTLPDAPPRSARRLMHDTLAPIVRERAADSELPGLRARRVLENRATDWRTGRTGEPLDERDLALVELGLTAMRELTADEQRLVSSSRKAQKTRQETQLRSQTIRRILFLSLVLAAGAAALFAFLTSRASQRAERGEALARKQEQEAKRQGQQAEDAATRLFQESGRQAWLNGQPGEALMYLGRSYSHYKKQDSPVALRVSIMQAVSAVDAVQVTFSDLKMGMGVSSASFSPDGSAVALTGRRTTWATCRDTGTGANLGDFTMTGSDEAEVVTFSPDGKRLIVGTRNDRINIYEPQTGILLSVLRAHNQPVTDLSFSRDGKWFVSTSVDGTAIIWDARTSRSVRVLRSHASPLLSARFSPDGQRIATTSHKLVIIWDARTGKRLLTIKDVEGHSTSFSADGKWIILPDSSHSARIFDASNGKAIAVLHGHSDRIFKATFSGDGALIATASQDQTVRLWDAHNFAPLAVLIGHHAAVTTVEFDLEGRRFVSGDEDGVAKIWSVKAALRFATLGSPTQDTALIGFLPDARIAAVSPDGTLNTYATNGNGGKLHPGPAGGGDPLALSRDGSLVVMREVDGRSATLWVGGQRRILAATNTAVIPLVAAQFSPDGGHLILIRAQKTGESGTIELDSGTIELWKVPEPQRLFAIEDYGTVAVFSQDGQRLLIAGDRNDAIIYNVHTGKPMISININQLDGHGMFTSAAAFSPDGLTVITVGRDSGFFGLHGFVGFWDALNGHLLHDSREVHGDTVRAVAYSADGTTVLTGSEDTTAVLWEARTYKPLRKLTGHSGPVTTVAISLHGPLAVTGSADATARLWDLQSGKLLSVLSGHHGPVREVIFSKDGASVLTRSQVGPARLWDVHPEMRPAADIDQLLNINIPLVWRHDELQLRLEVDPQKSAEAEAQPEE